MNYRAWLRTAGLLAVICGMEVAANAAGTNDLLWPSSAGTSSTSLAGAAVRMLGSLVLVLGLLFAGILLFKRWRGLTPGGKQPARIRVLETRSLAQRQTLYLVTCEGQRLLIAGSPMGISLVTQLPAQPAENLPEALASSPALHFVEALNNALGRKS